jgi:hypothetical protein
VVYETKTVIVTIATDAKAEMVDDTVFAAIDGDGKCSVVDEWPNYFGFVLCESQGVARASSG